MSNKHTRAAIARVLREALSGGVVTPLPVADHEVKEVSDGQFIVRVKRNPEDFPIYFKVTVSEMIG